MDSGCSGLGSGCTVMGSGCTGWGPCDVGFASGCTIPGSDRVGLGSDRYVLKPVAFHMGSGTWRPIPFWLNPSPLLGALNPRALHPISGTLHLDPGRFHLNLSEFHSNPWERHPNPGMLKTDPRRSDMDRGTLHLCLVGLHPGPGGVGMNPGRVVPDSVWCLTNPVWRFLNPSGRRLFGYPECGRYGLPSKMSGCCYREIDWLRLPSMISRIATGSNSSPYPLSLLISTG